MCLTLCDPINGSPPGSHQWGSPGKNTGVGCHFLLQYMQVKNESEGAQSCLTLRDPIDCSLPGSSVHGISQARVLELVAVQFNSIAQLCLTFCEPMGCSTLGFPVHHHLPELAQTHVPRVVDAIQPSHPLLSPSLPAFSLSYSSSNESALCIMWPKYWSFSFGISPSNQYSGLISFMIDWFDFLAVQGMLKTLLQHYNFTFFSSAISKNHFSVFQLSL